MGRPNDDWCYYDNRQISSIYLTVYEKVLALPGTQAIVQAVIDRMNGTTVASMEVVKQDHYYEWVPNVEFYLAVPGRDNFIKTNSTKTPDVRITLELIDFTPTTEEILSLFEANVYENGPIHMHGLMNTYSVRNGTKGNKNKFVPWFMCKTLKGPEITAVKDENERRLTREASRFVRDPAYNAQYIEARNRVGKMGVIKQLQNLKHLPLETIKEALNEFLCMDVMDEDA